VLYALMWSYAIQRVESKFGIKWKQVKEKPRRGMT